MISDADSTAPTPGQLRAAVNLGLIVPMDVSAADLWEMIHDEVQRRWELKEAQARKRHEKHSILVMFL